MSIIDLSSYRSIYTAYFVRMAVPDYQVLRYSTHYEAFSIQESDGNPYVYSNLGTLVGVSDTSFGIRSNTEDVVITISGIPLTNVSMVMNEQIKGSRVEIRRQFFNGSTYAGIGAPVIKFKGLVDNYAVIEDFPTDGSGIGTCTIQFMCSNIIKLMEKKTAGRRTNPLDEKIHFPSDAGMDRVPTIAGANYNFGAAK